MSIKRFDRCRDYILCYWHYYLISKQCNIIIDFCLKLVGRIIVALLCFKSGMYIGLKHCIDVYECVLVPVCCILWTLVV